MAGSSGMAWVKAAYEAGLISRTQMLRWARDGLVFRLRGSTDQTTRDAMERIKEVLNGASARQLERLALARAWGFKSPFPHHLETQRLALSWATIRRHTLVLSGK